MYGVDKFADIEVLRYRVPGFEDLSLKQKGGTRTASITWPYARRSKGFTKIIAATRTRPTIRGLKNT